MYWIEANPNLANPLRRNVALALFEPARRYALALGKAELRLIDPLPAVVPFYCSPALGFELVTPAKGGPYCRRRAVSTRTPYRDHSAALSATGRRARVADSIPTVEEAERRMTAAGPSPFSTPEAIEALGQAEEAAGGWLVGPAVYRSQGD